MKSRLLFVLMEFIGTFVFLLVVLTFPIWIIAWIIKGENYAEKILRYFSMEEWKKTKDKS